MSPVRVPAAAAWSTDPRSLGEALEIVDSDASASWREEYRAQACPLPDGGGSP